jgi:SAM-dependent methyltransferase
MKTNDEHPSDHAQVWERQMDRWRRMRQERGADPDSAAFWNGLHIWEVYMQYTNFPGPLLQHVLDAVEGSQTVLDIGAGSGSFTLPLARQAGWVTAVEPSSSQCRRLMRAVASEGIVNISVIQKDWNSVGLEEVGRHDIVVASYCLFMTGIVAAIHKMHQLARRRVFLVHLAGHDLQDMIREIRESDAEVPDHRLLLYVLKEMGLDVTARVFSRDCALPLNLQLEMFRSAQGFTGLEVRRLKRALEVSGRIEVKNGEPWIARTYQDALIAIEAGG